MTIIPTITPNSKITSLIKMMTMISIILMTIITINYDGFIVVDSFTLLSHQKLNINKNNNNMNILQRTLLHSTSYPLDGNNFATNNMKVNNNNKVLPEGIIKSIIVPGNGERVRLGDIATILYSCYVVHNIDNNNDMTTQPFSKSLAPEKFIIGNDGTMIDGWDISLRSMEIGERSIIRITDAMKYGYGTSGYMPYVPSNSIIEMDITILDSVLPTMNIDFDSIAEQADRNVPRTAKDIENAYKIKLDELERNKVELEGIDYWINKISNFYFYGFFDSETGATTAPWFLRPSITFPIAFAFVGALFYISLYYGAITERGIQSKDELDELILQTSTTSSTTSSFVLSQLIDTTTTSPLHDFNLLIHDWYKNNGNINE